MDDDKPVEPRLWPLRWILDEKFWRDIATQALGTGVVVVVGFLWASAAGYLSPDAQNAGDHWIVVLVGLALALIAVLQVAAVVYSVREMRRREGGRQIGYGVGLGVLMALGQGLVAVPFLVSVFSGRLG